MLYNSGENMKEDTDMYKKKYLLSFQKSLLTQVKRFTIKSILESLPRYLRSNQLNPMYFFCTVCSNGFYEDISNHHQCNNIKHV